jgi:predicted nucleic acid-binding protein
MLLAAVTVIGVSDRVERETIAFRRRKRLNLPDPIIGATAIAHGLTLLTLDKRLNVAMQG